MENHVATLKRILRLKSVLEATGLSRSTTYRLIKAGKFPSPVSLTGCGAVGWHSHEIDAWLDQRQPSTARRASA